MIEKNNFKNLFPFFIVFGIILNDLIYFFVKSNTLYYVIIGLLMILAPVMLRLSEKNINDNRNTIVLVVFELLLIVLVLVKYFIE
jgi:hypothetical protein